MHRKRDKFPTPHVFDLNPITPLRRRLCITANLNSRCRRWVTSGHPEDKDPMSALPPKADMSVLGCPLVPKADMGWHRGYADDREARNDYYASVNAVYSS